MTSAPGRPLTLRDRNRTLLRRQHLLERVELPAMAMVHHLVGLQAQENLPPYLSLAARLERFAPRELSDALEQARAVRLLTMRGTIHLLTPDDALTLRPWVQPVLDRTSRGNVAGRAAADVPVDDLTASTRRLLADGALPLAELGRRLAEAFPAAPAAALAQVARERLPLVQLPPRGLWKRSGGVVHQTLENHLGRPTSMPDVPELVRRYLRAFGPATAADMTTWSRVTRLGPVLAAMRDELVPVPCADGRTRYDVLGAAYAEGDEAAPVRLLGTYDNLWLSHADRDLVMPADLRPRWMGSNGGVASTVLVDGFLAGLWRRDGVRVRLELFGRLTAAQRRELDDEVGRLEELLAS